MLTIRGCRVSPGLLESWADRLVFDPEPVYVSESVKPLLPEGALVSPRREVSRSLDFADAYRTYHVTRAVDAPRQVVRLQTVVDAWAEDPLALSVYGPSA